jgi:hypothetical protein
MGYLRKAFLSLSLLVIFFSTLVVRADDPSELLALVNAERAHVCLAPLTFSWHLSEIAIRHTQDMVDRGYFSHTAPDPAPSGVTPAERISNGGYAWIWMGENLATGYGTVSEAFAAWMNSPGHRANILNPEFVEMGVARIGGTWTQLFGRSPNAGAPMPDCNLYGIHAAPISPEPPQPPAEQSQPPAEQSQPPVEQSQPPVEQSQPPAEQLPVLRLQPAAEQPIVEQPRSVIQVLPATQPQAQIVIVIEDTGRSTPSKQLTKQYGQ